MCISTVQYQLCNKCPSKKWSTWTKAARMNDHGYTLYLCYNFMILFFLMLMQTLPKGVSALRNLRELDLEGNKLEYLATEISECTECTYTCTCNHESIINIYVYNYIFMCVITCLLCILIHTY